MFQQGCLSYRVLTRALQALTEKAFLDGLRTPDKRPTAREWANALNWAVDELWQCGTCGLHYPYPHWVKPPQRRACPFCGERVEGLPSVLLLYEPRSKGRYAFVGRYLVFGNGWKLFPDVIDPTRNPPLSRKGEQIIGHVEWDSKKGTHYLVNDEEAAWSARLQLNKSSVDLARGASVALQAGNIIYFGEGRRIIVVGE